ncbi:outer membrane protein SusE [gut metagenome]|uniref:Outer membrane protein SusE n=1 Tax=gut metagenome TaxID=749906 RepID=J9FX07_9ZZZZ
MKKYFIAASLLLGGLFFTACDSDRDDNPTLQKPTTFVLNTPAYASGVYDLEHSTTLELTCSQPDYGYTASVTYAVDVALTENFEEFETLPSTYTSAKMNVMAEELAVAATTLKLKEGVEEDAFPLETALYIRLKASLGKDQYGNVLGEIQSNVVELPHVRLHFALPPVTLPETLYINGKGNNWQWENSLAFVPVHSAPGTWWRVVYLLEEFKFNSDTSWNGQEKGYGQCTIQDNAGAGISGDAEGANIKVANSGWYLVIIKGVVEGRNINYTVDIKEPNVYLIGPATGGKWDECMPDWKFQVPSTADGEFVSPAFAAAADAKDGVRIHVKIPETDWWKSEFMVFDGKIKYRGTGNDQDRITAGAGQKVYLNFSNDTGKIE